MDSFYRVRLQLSRDEVCISEAASRFINILVKVVPIITQLMEDMSQISEEDAFLSSLDPRFKYIQ